MMKKRVPKVLCNFGLVYEGKILSMLRGSDCQTSYEEVTGQTAGISECLDFKFYDLVWGLDHPMKPDINNPTQRLVQWLGVSHHVGSDMCYWLITESSKIISMSSVEHVT